jgi:hypothetical protein
MRSNPSQSIADLLHLAHSDYLRDVSPEEKIERPGNHDTQLLAESSPATVSSRQYGWTERQ